MNRTCDICGKECNEGSMKSVNIGRKKEWWCWECYLNSQREATASDRYRQKKLHNISKWKKRNK